jgi:ferrochelatase
MTPSPHDPISFDSVLLIAFGGPTNPDEIRPFLENIARGRPIPRQRLEEVAHHYEAIGGRSPLNELTVRQARALEMELAAGGPALPVYVGMRNWHPYVPETLAEMGAAGRRRAVGVILSAQQSEAGWGRYRENVAAARAEVGEGAPEVVFTAPWPEHPLFIEAVTERARAAFASVGAAHRERAALVFTAHSIPVAMAEGAPYVAQIERGAMLVAERLGRREWTIAYQSRSGHPRDPWLEPDVGDVIRDLAARRVSDVVIVPIGFVCDHVEVLYDLDLEARAIAGGLGIRLTRAPSVNDHPAFIRMLADVVRRTVAREQ